MNSDVVIINAAHWTVLNEEALTDPMRAGTSEETAPDAFENEPLTAEVAKIFREVTNLLLTPHIAGVAAESNTRVRTMIARHITPELGLTNPTNKYCPNRVGEGWRKYERTHRYPLLRAAAMKGFNDILY